MQATAVDNAAIRAISDLDTLETSQVLRRLHHNLGLLNKCGAGSATYYQLNYEKIAELVAERGELAANTSDLGAYAGDLDPNVSNLAPDTSNLGSNASDPDLPLELVETISSLSTKPRKETLWPVILKACAFAPMTSSYLAMVLNRREDHLKTNHLTKMRKEGLLNYLYPEVVNHPQQAYVTTEQGKAWLKTHKE